MSLSTRESVKSTTSSNRVKVIAGRVHEGDTISGRRVTGLGKTWVETIRDEDACVWRLQPGQDYRVTMQYAYFS